MPRAFTARFLDRLHDGKLDCGQALDLCELNPSPAANVALAAVRRWGRPAGDLERAVALAHRVETDRLRRNVGTLRRIAVLTPLLGLLGTLFALGRALEAPCPREVRSGVGPGSLAAAATLTPLSAGIVIATLSLIAYDALLIRIEKLAGGLDRLGAETIDAIALAAPISTPTMALAHGEPRPTHLRPDSGRTGPASAARSPHQSYFRLDDGTGMIRHPGEHSKRPVTASDAARRRDSPRRRGLGGPVPDSTLGYHGETLAGGQSSREMRSSRRPGRIEGRTRRSLRDKSR